MKILVLKIVSGLLALGLLVSPAIADDGRPVGSIDSSSVAGPYGC